MAESTWQTYKTASDSFNRFRYLYGLPLSWPAPLEHIIQFIVSMSAEGKAFGSIRTLQFGDIAIVEANGCKHVKVTIRQSKTDQLGYSSTLFLSESRGQACPVMAVVDHLRWLGGQNII